MATVVPEESASTKQRKLKKQAARLSRQLGRSEYTPSDPVSDVESPGVEFDGDIDTTAESPVQKEKEPTSPPASPDNYQPTDHDSSFQEYNFCESQEIPETDLIKFVSSEGGLFVNNKFLPSESSSAVAGELSSELADCEDLGLDWDTPPGSFESLSPLFDGEEVMDYGFSDPIAIW